MDWEKAVEIAAHVTHPVTVTAIAIIVAAFAFSLEYRARKPRLAWLFASALLVLGLAPLAASTFLQTRGVYRVRVIVKSPDQQLTTDAIVTSSIGGEIKKAEAGWEVDIAPQVRPESRSLTLYARRANAYQSGSTTIELTGTYYPETTILLMPLPSTVIRGIVKNTLGRSVISARVSVPGYHDFVLTDEMGNFQLPAHAAAGQMIAVDAEKGDLVADRTVPAGSTLELTVRKLPIQGS
ncbi:MAG: hypothetical protein ACR2IV_23080 [Bryobacteraceae bacterium]